MKTTHRKPFGKGELRIGCSSWNEKEQSLKWAYPDRRGRTSIRSPELPLDVLVELLIFAKNEGILSIKHVQRVRDTFIN